MSRAVYQGWVSAYMKERGVIGEPAREELDRFCQWLTDHGGLMPDDAEDLRRRLAKCRELNALYQNEL